jgi:hypothetical protein
MHDADGWHASADAWDAYHREMDRAFRSQGRATGAVRRAARRIAAEMLAVGATPADVRDALRRSVCRHSLEIALELGRETEAWAASGARGGSFLADVLQCVTSQARVHLGAESRE